MRFIEVHINNKGKPSVSFTRKIKMKVHAVFIVLGTYFLLTESKCTNETHGLYCINLIEDENNLLVFNMANGTMSTESVFLRNISGDISDSSFAAFPNVTSLDIQFSSINNFSLESVTLNSLYLIKNFVFPNLTKDSLKECCRDLTILFVADNQELSIENGAFRNMENLHHLTIIGQEISNVSKNFSEGLAELTYLNLERNGIHNIEENAFDDLENLNYLVLNENDITQFEDNTFTSLKNLESLELFGLSLKNLNLSIFRNQRELRYIGIPSKLVKEQLQLEQLTHILTKLETIGLEHGYGNPKLI
ncbi:hypothetical protein JTB14_016104 [Gonioctena quinquepunctata]|nr:hypothetical protein JTB14_016104 [Gonioctena quinquepunctata]